MAKFMLLFKDSDIIYHRETNTCVQTSYYGDIYTCVPMLCNIPRRNWQLCSNVIYFGEIYNAFRCDIWRLNWYLWSEYLLSQRNLCLCLSKMYVFLFCCCCCFCHKMFAQRSEFNFGYRTALCKNYDDDDDVQMS